MSLAIAYKSPEGVILAADSRVTLTMTNTVTGDRREVFFDNATKLLTFTEPDHNYCAAITYGEALIGTGGNSTRTAHSFMPEFESTLPEGRLPTGEIANRMSDFFLRMWQGANPGVQAGPGVGEMYFTVGGYDVGEPYGHVYQFGIPGSPTPQEVMPTEFGLNWGGQGDVASRILKGYEPGLMPIIQRMFGAADEQMHQLAREIGVRFAHNIPYNLLPLQDCVDLVNLLIRTTIAVQQLSLGIRGVGGAIDMAVIRRDGATILQQKELVGERSPIQ